jgi:hypothetical protein
VVAIVVVVGTAEITCLVLKIKYAQENRCDSQTQTDEDGGYEEEN